MAEWQQVILGDNLEVLPTLAPGCVDAIITDPPYQTAASGIPQRGRGVSERIEESLSVGQPWGYSLDWIDACKRLNPAHWIVFCNYAMLGDICSRLPPSAVFVWRKSNAPRMARPVPRLDCEFIVWHRAKGASCGDMGKFESLVLDVPMPQAGCFATERILCPESGKALHPCQKPLAIVRPFVERLPIRSVVDPFMGTGTTGVACYHTMRSFIGIENNPEYFALAERRLREAENETPLFRNLSPES